MAEIGHQTTRSSGPSNSVTHATANGNASVHVGNNYNLPKDDYLEALWVTDPKMDKERIENAKGGLHTASYTWILRNRDFETLRKSPDSHLLWVKGDPGKGKTMLLCGIINELTSSSPPETLIAYFFCQATDDRLNNATAVLRGLIYMLVEKENSLEKHLREKYKGIGKQVFEGPNSWFVLENIFVKMLKDAGFKSAYIIVDALDECRKDLRQLLSLVNKTASTRTKWIVSSRHESGIEHGLQLTGSRTRLSLELKENAEEVKQAVDAYIDHCVSKLSTIYGKELQDQIRKVMRQKANGTFLWVSIVFWEIMKDSLLDWELKTVLEEVPDTLKGLYGQTMERIQRLGRPRRGFCRRLLATVITALRPLRLEELAVVSGLAVEHSLNQRNIEIIANSCRSFLTIQGQTVSIIHQSAKDFLCTNEFLFPFGNMAETHGTIVSTSLQAMSKTLRRDVYNLGCIGKTITEVKPPKEDPLASIQYSCVFWADHLDEGLSAIETLAQKSNQPPGEDDYYAKVSAQFNSILQDNGAVHQFLTESYLFWLEALSLLQSIPEGIIVLKRLESLVMSRIGDSNLLEFVQDARRFCLRQSSMITEAPLQVYASALLFSPRQSIVRKQFEDKELKCITIKPHVEDYWNPCLATVAVDKQGESVMESVNFSPNGRLIASTSSFGEIKIWHADTGALQASVGDEDPNVMLSIESVEFSPCGKRIATRSLEEINLWCIETGSCQMTFDPLGSPVYSTVFSPDGAHITSALGYVGNIEIRDIPTRECLPTLRIRRDSCVLRTMWAKRGVTSASFSPNGQVLAVRSQNIQLWDAFTGVCQMTLNTDANKIESVVFSEDGSHIAATSKDGAVELWNLQTGANQKLCRAQSGRVCTVAFSPDGKYLASGSNDDNVYLWDLHTGSCLLTLAGHDDMVECVAFSPDSQRLVSSSVDSTLRIWDLKDSSTQTAIKDRNETVERIVFSPDNRHVASSSRDYEVKLWNTSTGKCLFTTSGHYTKTLFTPNSQHFITSPGDSTIEVWDLATYGRHAFNVDGNPESMVPSPDGRKLAYIRWEDPGEGDVNLLDIETDKQHKVAHFNGCWEYDSPYFHSTGKYVGLKDEDNTFEHVWDISDNPAEKPLEDQGMDGEEYTSYYPKVRLEVLPPQDQHLTTAILDASVANCGLSNNWRWITYRGQNKILLPLDYDRPLGWKSRDNMIAITGRRGDLIVIGFGDNVP